MDTLEDEILHARFYDPVRAHQYYLRTRALKGRNAGNTAVATHPGSNATPTSGSGASNVGMRDSRKAALEAQREKYRATLDRLETVLRAKVKAAKARAGVKEPTKAASTATTKDPQETADKNTKAKSDSSPLTEKQKSDKREASKKQYEKEHGMSLSKEVQALHRQILDVRAKIKKASEDARDKTSSQTDGNERSSTSTERSQSNAGR